MTCITAGMNFEWLTDDAADGIRGERDETVVLETIWIRVRSFLQRRTFGIQHVNRAVFSIVGHRNRYWRSDLP